jgi:hypothetical protein
MDSTPSPHLEPVLALLVDGYEVVSVVGRAVRLVLEGTLLRQQADVYAGEVYGPGIRSVRKIFPNICYSFLKIVKYPARTGRSAIIFCIFNRFFSCDFFWSRWTKDRKFWKVYENLHLTL